MPIMDWSSDLDVGVERMNDEHKNILELMNRIADAAEAGQRGPTVTTLIDKLDQVTIDHFRDEEAFMASINYEGLASHKLVHQSLLKKYGEFADRIHADNGELPHQFLEFLKLWLTAHIKGVDMNYSPKASMKLAG